MPHFHYPDGNVLGKPDHQEGSVAIIGAHRGEIVNATPYGRAHKSSRSNLPLQPQDPGFSPSREDVLIKPYEPHGHINPHPHMLVLSV